MVIKNICCCVLMVFISVLAIAEQISFSFNLKTNDEIKMKEKMQVANLTEKDIKMRAVSQGFDLNKQSIRGNNSERALTNLIGSINTTPIGFNDEYICFNCFSNTDKKEIQLTTIDSSYKIKISYNSTASTIQVNKVLINNNIGIIYLNKVVAELKPLNDSTIQIDIYKKPATESSEEIQEGNSVYFRYWSDFNELADTIGSKAKYRLFVKGTTSVLPTDQFGLGGETVELNDKSMICIQASATYRDVQFKVPIINTSLKKITFNNGGGHSIPFDKKLIIENEGILISAIKKSLALNCSDIPQIVIDADNDNKYEYYFRYIVPIELYRTLNKQLAGFYLSTNLYSLSFTSDGAVASALPIGLGWGFKIWRKAAYLGFSGILNWSCYSNTITNEDNTTTQQWVFTSALAGLRFDFSNYASLGFGYSFDCTGKPNLGITFFASIGPDLLGLLQK